MQSSSDIETIAGLSPKEYRRCVRALSPEHRQDVQRRVRKHRNLLQARKSRLEKRLQCEFLARFYHSTRTILQDKTLDQTQKIHHLHAMYDVEEDTGLGFLDVFSEKPVHDVMVV